MILDNIRQLENYSPLISYTPRITSFLHSLNDAQFEGGKVEIEGDKLIAIFYQGKAGLPVKMESHRKYLDLHYVYKGQDTVKVAPLVNCPEVLKEYDEQKDVMFFPDGAGKTFTIDKNEFAVFFPEDVHSPLIGSAECWKIVFKIAIK